MYGIVTNVSACSEDARAEPYFLLFNGSLSDIATAKRDD